MIKRVFIVLLLLLSTLLLYQPETGAQTSGTNQMVALVNQLRANNGLPPLRESCILDASAQAKAQDMGDLGYFAHQSPNGWMAEQWKQSQGYPANSPGYGENILWSGSSVQDAFNIWADSPDHYNNMVSPNYTEIGIGIVETSAYYWGIYVMHFGNASTGSCGSSDPAPPSSTDSARTTTSVNLRTGASLSASVIKVLPTNTLVTLIGGFKTADGYTWANVTASGSTGWIASEYVAGLPSVTITPTPSKSVTPSPTSTRTPSNTVTPTLTLTKSSTPSGSGFGVTTTTVNLRSSGSLNASVVSVLSAGTPITFLGPTTRANGYTWANVLAKSLTGWIATAYVSTQVPTRTPTKTATRTPTVTSTPTIPATTAPDTGIATNDWVNLRNQPGLQWRVLTTLAPGTPVELLSGDTIAASGYTWANVRVNGFEGWLVLDYIDGWVLPALAPEEAATEEIIIEETPIPTEVIELPTELPTETPTEEGTPQIQ